MSLHVFPRRTFTALALALLGSTALPALAQTNADPTVFVGDFAQKGINDILTANIPNAEKQARFREMFIQYFDLPAIGRFILARYWKAASPDEQAKFTTLFEDVIVYTWSRRFSEYNGQTLMVTSKQPDGETGVLVKSTIIGAGSSKTSFGVDWRLRQRPEGWKVMDIVIEGVSMAITYRQDYATIISQTGSFAGLLSQMEKQVADLKAQQKA